ncbi:MAG: NAD-dependent protein deacylase [Turneriella sp.]|nr:NAD-dependent protein deacylase [Turneriella sp.]
MPTETQLAIQRAAQILLTAKHPILLTGAGISAESGIPTFRGKEGLWKNFRAEDLATPEAFSRDRKLVWEWYNWRKRLILSKKPNEAHYAAYRLKEKLPNLLCITQNVDSLHKRAGLKDILEMHGNIFRVRCQKCFRVGIIEGEVTHETACKYCNLPELRPDIVWFGEALDASLMHEIHSQLLRCDVILVVGTSGHVYPAAGFAIEVRRRGGYVIEINTDENHRAFPNDIYLQGNAATLLPQLDSLLSGD